MFITNSKGVRFQTHVINQKIVTTKLPNLGKGKSWKTKAGKLDGKDITMMYNDLPGKTGVYFKANNEMNYTPDRVMLDSTSFTTAERAPRVATKSADGNAKKPAATKKVAAPKADKKVSAPAKGKAPLLKPSGKKTAAKTEVTTS